MLINFDKQKLYKIFTIFLVGLSLRYLINVVFDIHVFKDWNNIISLAYYGFMALFAVYFYSLYLELQLPTISEERVEQTVLLSKRPGDDFMDNGSKRPDTGGDLPDSESDSHVEKLDQT